ncbi:hypothetical protein jhhlp_007022 [Lomentospora prolificans]|uniref:Major facilitator superfamily (MFS) profile domain-containing protein n=1 Tax=Lomentospora prolificans TaxID=41688 RepID=A0A2N3N1G2_9PEZI|nr:hypothetical protein jhhlp_007022 [Lomentospora prolificans]
MGSPIGQPDHTVGEKVASTSEGSVDVNVNVNDPQAAFLIKRQDRKLLRRLDWILLPWLCLLYLLAFLDRTNIGNAKIAGLTESLHISTPEYNVALTIFFVSYSIFEPLTNVLLKSWRPSRFIPVIVILWGLSMTGMGFVTNWSGLMAARWFLGLTEAGLFPGINYYLSCWYKKSELGVRAAIFFSAAAASGSFGGLLAAAIQKMDGLGGRPGWAWIFILEGILTVVAGFASFWLVLDFPEEAKFLSEEDRKRVLHRLKEDQQNTADKESYKSVYLWSALKDWKTWLSMAIYMGCDMPLYAFSLFLPSIIKSLGWNTSIVRSQLLSAAPYIAAAALTVAVGFIADRTRRRGLCNLVASSFGIVGFAMLLGSQDPAVKYAATFLAALGIYPCISNTISWVSNNTEGVYKRGIVLGMTIGWGNLTGVVSSNIYFSEPKFLEGHAVVLAFLSIFLFGGSALMLLSLAVENKKRRDGRQDMILQGKSESEVEELGDKHPRFVYTL